MVDWVHLLVATCLGTSSVALSTTPNVVSTRLSAMSFSSSRLDVTTGTLPGSQTLRVLSWNVLAQCYVKNPPASWVDDSSFDPHWSDWLDWDYRREKIATVLSEGQADIVCLQEVQTSMIENDLQVLWDQLGYDTHIQETTKDHPVANVILLSKELGYRVVLKESRSRALFLIVQPADSPKSTPLFIVNVHLQASGRSGFTENAQTRFSQVQSLVKRIDLAWTRIQLDQCSAKEQHHLGECNWGSQPNLLIMGDFNLNPTEPLYSLLVEGTWPNEAAFRNYLPAKVSEASASSLPLLPWHDVRLDRANHRLDEEQQQPWTYAPTKQTFDYIFVSGNANTLARHDYVLPHRLADLVVPSNEESHGRFLWWPNQYHPSDHIPIGATVEFQQPR